LKDQKRIHIDKVEYKFDQLKVEKLDGTLNIGLTPGALEDLTVNGNTVSSGDENASNEDMEQDGKPVQPAAELQSQLYRELKQYVETQVPKQIEQLKAQSGQQLDSWHQKMIIDDLLKQTDARTNYYLQQMTPGATEDNLSSIKDSVLFRTKNDINAAVDNYFNKFKKNAGES
jgi:spore germination protein PC